MSDEIARYNNRMYARELRRKKREKDTLAFFSDEEVMCAYANVFSAGADEEYENQELKEVIRGIIKNDLSEMQRKAIIYVFYEGYTHRQAAELMGVNRSTIEVYISRALAKIKKKLDDMDIM